MKKLFVLIRKDLPEAYRGVQGGHAVAEFMLHFPDNWKNEILVYLGVKNLYHLERIKESFEKENIRFAEFKEPDIGNELTAIATDVENKITQKLNLMR